MNRRGFLGLLAAFAAQCTLDPELALWKPGVKVISIPKPKSLALMSDAYDRAAQGLSIRYIREWDRADFYYITNEPCLKIWPPLQPSDPRAECIANALDQIRSRGWAPTYPEYNCVVMG